MLRVTSDKRMRVMHEKGGEVIVIIKSIVIIKMNGKIKQYHHHDFSRKVYVLLISNVTVGDEGLYTCEVNFNPVLRSFHQLKVLSAII